MFLNSYRLFLGFVPFEIQYSYKQSIFLPFLTCSNRYSSDLLTDNFDEFFFLLQVLHGLDDGSGKSSEHVLYFGNNSSVRRQLDLLCDRIRQNPPGGKNDETFQGCPIQVNTATILSVWYNTLDVPLLYVS